MKRYKIIHRTYYNYSEEVTLGRHQLLLRPREDYELRIESFHLKSNPEVKIFWNRDVEGNSLAIANFNQTTQQLFIESEVIIQQFNESPLDFMVANYAIEYPFSYKDFEHVSLFPYMTLPSKETKTILNAWIANFYEQSEAIQTYSLLQRLTKHIYHTLV
ncbi:MAG: Cysteine protease, partial [uncultured Sulfurovum sp.]